LQYDCVGAQPVSIGLGCEYTGIVVHEMLHAVGLWHEQSRADRDDYVTVYFSNIQSGKHSNKLRNKFIMDLHEK